MDRYLDIYRFALERSRFPSFLLDADGRVLWQNDAAREALGYADRALVGKPFSRTLRGAPASSAHDRDLEQAVTGGGTALRLSWTVYRADGAPLQAVCSAYPIIAHERRLGVSFVVDQTMAAEAPASAPREVDFSEEKLRLATEVAGIGMFEYSVPDEQLTWNDTMRRHFGLAPGAPVNTQTFLLGMHPDDRERVWRLVQGAYAPGGGGRYRAEYRTVGLADGKERWINSTGQVFFDEHGKPLRLIGSAIDVTERRVAENTVREAAQRDSLTGLPNRALLFDYGERLLASARRQGHGAAVLFIDLDRFKAINDLHSHAVGDKLLQQVAQRLSACTRQEDIVCRLGGDEFILVLPRVGEANSPEAVAESVLRHLVRPFEVGELTLEVSASIGISLLGRHGDELGTLVRCADLAMYAAKKHGRNKVQMYTEGLDERAHERLQLEIRLREAVHRGAMVLFYQPIISVDSGALVGAEALIRLPQGGAEPVGPDRFIPLAESTGLIERMGEWVADEACRQHQRWCEQGLPPLTIAINVSPIEFRQRSFATRLFNTISQCGIDPQFLQIEVTESTLMDDLEDTVRTLSDIKALGIKVALDDFGTGYSSLSYLSTLPLDKLKIDKSFIRAIESSEINQAITDAIIGLAKNLKLKVVGEGIESGPAMEYLRRAGCDQAQGYLFSEPLSGPDFAQWYASYIPSASVHPTPSRA